jgi:tyrosyl-tRNA synthetase
MPILVGTDGVQKMSKSLGNYVALEEPPGDMYGKIMSLPDELLLQYFQYLTDVPDAEISAMGDSIANEESNPMDFKKQLARIITETFHDVPAARAAEVQFEQVVQRRDLPNDMPEYSLAQAGDVAINRLLVQAELVASNGEARRLVGQGAVEIIRPSGDRVTIVAGDPTPPLAPGDVIRAGRRRFVRLVQ